VEALASKVGRRGTVVLPTKLLRRMGIKEGSFVVAEEREDGILIRPAIVLPIEIYTPERRAEFPQQRGRRRGLPAGLGRR
jgi:AbrB family looped-hinge helix DNA binding protein